MKPFTIWGPLAPTFAPLPEWQVPRVHLNGRAQMHIPDDYRFVAARCGGYECRIYDDGFGPLWIARNSIGIDGIVRAQTGTDAYEICEDEFFPECLDTIEELESEYGPEWSESPLFSEAYGFRPNGPNSHDKINHGIYSRDLNGESLDLLTDKLATAIGITIEIEPW